MNFITAFLLSIVILCAAGAADLCTSYRNQLTQCRAEQQIVFVQSLSLEAQLRAQELLLGPAEQLERITRAIYENALANPYSDYADILRAQQAYSVASMAAMEIRSMIGMLKTQIASLKEHMRVLSALIAEAEAYVAANC